MANISLLRDFDNTLAKRNGCGLNHYVIDWMLMVTMTTIKNYFSKDFPWQRHTEAHKDYF